MKTDVIGAMVSATISTALIALPSFAWASTPFPSCDGYAAPNRTADEVTAHVGMGPPGLISALLYRPRVNGASPDTKALELGAVGVDACDAALADPALLPTYWLRKVNLLRARAVNDLAAGDFAAALSDVDRAKAAAEDRNDPYYARSLGISLDLIRAYALRKSGRADEAIELAMRTWSQRPYDLQVGWASLAAMGPSAPRADVKRVLMRVAALQPSAINNAFLKVIVADGSDAEAAYAGHGPDLSVRQLFDALPYPEAASLVNYHPAMVTKHPDTEHDLALGGYRVTEKPGGPTVVQLRAAESTPQMVEEMALLRAAELARDQHRKGFVIVSNDFMNHRLQTVYGGVVVQESVLTRQASLDIIIADPDALPPGYTDAGWRLLDADAIYNALAPIYIRATSKSS
jgi:hypothetical protein